jgi:hypothetical protein
MNTMSTSYDKAYDAALELSREQRINLAHDLLSTVAIHDFPPGPKVTREEILKAAQEVRNGTAKTRDAFEVLDELDREFANEENTSALPGNR